MIGSSKKESLKMVLLYYLIYHSCGQNKRSFYPGMFCMDVSVRVGFAVTPVVLLEDSINRIGSIREWSCRSVNWRGLFQSGCKAAVGGRETGWNGIREQSVGVFDGLRSWGLFGMVGCGWVGFAIYPPPKRELYSGCRVYGWSSPPPTICMHLGIDQVLLRLGQLWYAHICLMCICFFFVVFFFTTLKKYTNYEKKNAIIKNFMVCQRSERGKIFV